MNKRIVTVGKSCKLNRESITAKNTPDSIYYLDTGNITRNKIDGLQFLQKHNDSYPSRAKRKVKNNTIIYSTVRPNQEHYGILKNPTDNLIVSTGFTTLDVIDDDLDPLFLYYSLTKKEITEYLHMIAENSVSSYPSINPGDIGNLSFNVPSDKSAQQNIAAVLSALDAKIDLNNRINAQLEMMAKTLYDYWFVQFDFPDKKGKPYKSSGGKMVYDKQLKRHIPDGWEVNPIAYWIAHDKTGDWGKECEQGNYTQKVICIRGTDINGLNGIGTIKSPIRYILDNNSNKLLESHDLIVEISGGAPTQSTGRLSYITEETLARFSYPLICSNFCKAIVLKDKRYLYSLVYMWQNLYDNGIFFGWEGKTSGIKNFLFDSFVNSYLVVMPEKKINDRFYDTIRPLQSKKQKLILENQQLTELRDWLLPMLMNGQASVK